MVQPSCTDAVAGRAQPTGITEFQEHHPHTGEWADRRAGPLSVHQAHLEPASSSLFAAASLMLLLMGGEGAEASFFIH